MAAVFRRSRGRTPRTLAAATVPLATPRPDVEQARHFAGAGPEQTSVPRTMVRIAQTLPYSCPQITSGIRFPISAAAAEWASQP